MNEIEIHILRRLWRHGYSGRRHTAREHMKQGIPSELKNMKIINKACDNLINEGFLEKHHTKRISLNRKRLKEIEKLIYSF